MLVGLYGWGIVWAQAVGPCLPTVELYQIFPMAFNLLTAQNHVSIERLVPVCTVGKGVANAPSSTGFITS